MNKRNPDLWIEAEAMHRAAATGDLTKIEHLLRAGYAVSGFDEFGETPLHHAVRAEQFKAVKSLLEHGAAVNALNDFTRTTPIGLAAAGDDPAIVALLLAHGADPYLVGTSMGQCALDYARQNRNEYGDEIRQMLKD